MTNSVLALREQHNGAAVTLSRGLNGFASLD